jgi:phenylalanyl-tRNA synthetase alpha chain
MTIGVSGMAQLEDIAQAGIEKINRAQSIDELEGIRVQYLGKKGILTEQLKSLGRLPAEERPKVGAQINALKQELQKAIANRQHALKEAALAAQLESERIDVTEPARGAEIGALHPVNRTIVRITEFFVSMGFSVAEGPEIEDDYHNFEALNIPPHHPARAMHDTFYFADGTLLRTQTSDVQIRVMESQKSLWKW